MLIRLMILSLLAFTTQARDWTYTVKNFTLSGGMALCYTNHNQHTDIEKEIAAMKKVANDKFCKGGFDQLDINVTYPDSWCGGVKILMNIECHEGKRRVEKGPRRPTPPHCGPYTYPCTPRYPRY